MSPHRTAICNATAGITTLLIVSVVEIFFNPVRYVWPVQVSQVSAKPIAVLTVQAPEFVAMPRPAPTRSVSRIDSRRAIAAGPQPRMR